MKSITKKGVLALFVSAIMLTAINAQPRGGYGTGYGYRQAADPDNPGWQGQRIENILPDLTEEQLAAIEELRLEHFKKVTEHRNQMGELRARQRTIMSAYKVDQKAAQDLIDQKTALINKQMKEQVEHRAAVNNILTEDQVLKLQQLRPCGRFDRGRAARGPQRAGRPAGRGLGPCGGANW